MGGRRRLRRHRTALAALLTLVAVAVPCGAWFVVGSRSQAREAELTEKGVYQHGYKKAVRLAERLAARFEVLREVESRRPFYHYQNLFHDPQGASEGAAVSLSPLAHGPADPLIEAHFQIDAEGRLTLPTLNEQFPELGLQNADASQCWLQERLERVSVFYDRELLEAEAATDPGRHREGNGAGRIRVEPLELGAWKQHLQANALYADLKYAHGTPKLELDDDGARKVEIRVKGFEWRTLPFEDEPGLVALREVETPEGVWIQGFLIADETVRHYLAESPYPTGFGPLPELEGREEGHLVVAVAGTPWGIGIDVSSPLAETRAAAELRRASFERTFALGALAAGLAGLLVVGMVYQAERLAQQRSRFAASAAHELRTPLAGLRLYGEMLAEGLGNPTRARDYARRLAGEAERLGRVVTNVLSFTRLERETLSVSPEPGDLGAAVRDAVARQQPALEEAGAQLELDIPDGLPAARFDRDALSNILQNLLDNAEKYTRGVEDRKVRVSVAAGDDTLALAVADNGRGVTGTLRRRLFRPFARGEENEATAGLGLGLVLVQALARAQGGDIRYGDGPEGGAVFTVTFPVAA